MYVCMQVYMCVCVCVCVCERVSVCIQYNNTTMEISYIYT